MQEEESFIQASGVQIYVACFSRNATSKLSSRAEQCIERTTVQSLCHHCMDHHSQIPLRKVHPLKLGKRTPAHKQHLGFLEQQWIQNPQAMNLLCQGECNPIQSLAPSVGYSTRKIQLVCIEFQLISLIQIPTACMRHFRATTATLGSGPKGSWSSITVLMAPTSPSGLM